MSKTCTIILLALSVSGCSGGVSVGSGAEESSAQGALTGGVYQLRTLAHAGSCLDVTAAGTANGTNLQEWTCNGGGAQSFTVDDLGGGFFRIVNTNSNKCVDATANGTADGTNVQLYDCNGTGAQAWQFVDVGSGNVKIVGKTSGKCLDVFKSLPADGTNVQLWTCNGGNSQAWNQASINGNASRHQLYGEQILDKLNAKFYEPSTGLYVNAVDAHEVQSGGTGYLWPTAHMMRALTWGALVNPGKYSARLHSFVGNVERYRDTTVSGYSSTANGKGDRYYDDNAQLGNALTDVYQKVFPEQAILNQSIVAFRSCINGRDSDWSIPQLDSSRGIMFTMSVTPTALNASKLAQIGGASDYASIATKYYSMFTDPNVHLRESNLLFGQGSRDTNGVWTEIGGLRAYQTAYVGQLASKLYATTHDTAYLNYARDTANAVLNRWYKPGKGLSEIAFWGGNDTIDMLIDLYEVDPDPKWVNAARDIVDFVIANGRDTLGYYPSGGDSRGAWNAVQTNVAPPGSIAMMSQASAANAILRLAYCEAHTPGCAGTP